MSVGEKLIIHSILQQSEVNGPGERLVIWTQGCTKGCVGCFNPETWKFKPKAERKIITVGSVKKFADSGGWYPVHLAAQISSYRDVDGITFTGGDPLEQPEALLKLLKILHAHKAPEELPMETFPKGIICFTGFVIEELSGAALECLPYIDLLIDGRYVEQLRYSSGLAGSSNQRFHFNPLPGRGESRLTRDEIEIDQSVEIHSDPIDSDIIRVTGFPVIDRAFLREMGLVVETSDIDSESMVD